MKQFIQCKLLFVVCVQNHHELLKKDVVLEKDAKQKQTDFLSKVSSCVQNGFCGTNLVPGMKMNGLKTNGHCMPGKGNGIVSNGHVKNGKRLKVNGSGHLMKNGCEKNGHRNVIGHGVTEAGSGEKCMVRQSKGVGHVSEEQKTSVDKESSVSETLQSGHIKVSVSFLFEFKLSIIAVIMTNMNVWLADRTNGRAYATVLRLSSVTLCIVAKWCVVEQKLLLRAYRKSYMRNRLIPK